MTNDHDLELIELGTRLGTKAYLREIWNRRDFLAVIPRQDARSRQMTTVLGQAWHLLNPLIMTGVYYLVFKVILKADRGIDSYISFLTIGLLMFQLCQRITQDAATVIVTNESLIRSLQFPRALLPLSIAIQHLISFGPAVVVMLAVTFAEHQAVSWRILLLPVTIGSAMLVSMGMALIAARVGAFVHDLREILPHLFRILLYFSGVLFSIQSLVANQLARNILSSNPIYDFITLARWSLIGTPVGERVVYSLIAWSIIMPIVGIRVFRGAEHRYGG